MPCKDDAQEKTAAALSDPQPGDRFTELYSFWLYVIRRDGDIVWTLEGNPPVKFPEEGTLRVQPVAELRRRLSYGSIPGFWVWLVSRSENIQGWYEAALASRCQSSIVIGTGALSKREQTLSQ